MLSLYELWEFWKLKYKLNDYLSAHPVDIQRGDAVPPFTEYIEFLNINLK